MNDAAHSPGWFLIGSDEETQEHQLLFADCGIIRYRDACELWLPAGTDEDELTDGDVAESFRLGLAGRRFSPETAQ